MHNASSLGSGIIVYFVHRYNPSAWHSAWYIAGSQYIFMDKMKKVWWHKHQTANSGVCWGMVLWRNHFLIVWMFSLRHLVQKKKKKSLSITLSHQVRKALWAGWGRKALGLFPPEVNRGFSATLELSLSRLTSVIPVATAIFLKRKSDQATLWLKSLWWLLTWRIKSHLL